MDDKNILLVKTFGGFSLTWNGINICGGIRSGDSHFTRLMQILIHNRDKGVGRIQLQELLFEDSNAEDMHHLLRSVMYNARKKLEEAGLPKCNYIVFADGRYTWTPEIPVKEDAAVFEELYAKACEETDASKRAHMFLEACYYYEGEFLPYQTRLVWVAQEERKYRRLFSTCVNQAAEALRAEHDWTGLEKLGRHAYKVSPLNEWEILSMEALVAMGKYRAAQELYAQTTEYYQRELGVRPSLAMVSKLEQYASRIAQPYSRPESIQADLEEPEEELTGGYYCTYNVFRGIYRMISRTMDRCGRYAFLMICSLKTNETFAENGSKAPSDDAMDRLSERMKNIICTTVRKSDIVCRYGKAQYMIILMNRTVESCEIVSDRIDRNFKKGGFDLTIEYSIRPVRSIESYGIK